MNGFWPVIEYTRRDGKADKQWTYDSCYTFDDAVDVIRSWAEMGYQITHAYVDVYHGDVKERTEVDLVKYSIYLMPPEPEHKPAGCDWIDEYL